MDMVYDCEYVLTKTEEEEDVVLWKVLLSEIGAANIVYIYVMQANPHDLKTVSVDFKAGLIYRLSHMNQISSTNTSFHLYSYARQNNSKQVQIIVSQQLADSEEEMPYEYATTLTSGLFVATSYIPSYTTNEYQSVHIGAQSIIIEPSEDSTFIINVQAKGSYVLTAIEGNVAQAIPEGFVGTFAQNMTFTLQSFYDLSGLTIEACYKPVSAKVSFYGIPSLNPAHAFDLKSTSVQNKLRAIMSTHYPMNFFIEVTSEGSYYIQNAPVDPRPAIGATTIRVAKNNNSTITLRVDAPVTGQAVNLVAYMLNEDEAYASNTACGV